MKKRHDSSVPVTILASGLLVAAPGAATSLIEFNHGLAPDYSNIGWGYVAYDRAASFDAYREWWERWARCERSGEFEPCANLPDQFDFSLRIKEAAMGPGEPWEIPTWVPVHDWNMHAERPHCDIGRCVGSTETHILLGDVLGGMYVDWSCSGQAHGPSTFSFTLSPAACRQSLTGFAVRGTERWDTGQDGYGFAWHRVYLPEPGTLALLGLGLVGLRLSRRRRAT